MRRYIQERIKNTTKQFKFGNCSVEERDEMPSDINLPAIFKTVEKSLPPHYFTNLKGVVIEHLPEFDERGTNAVYRDNTFYITNNQSNADDLINDILHEFAHHLEANFPEIIYGDKKLINEFKKKREQLKFEIMSEGYWVDEYDFQDIKFNQKFDDFLYKRLGKNMLKMVTSGIFIRPYAAVSLREYFATGFEAYYLGQREYLKVNNPALHDKIEEIHNYKSY